MVFKRTKIVSTPLEFQVDYREGKTEILVFQTGPQDKILVNNVSDLWRHGFVEESNGIKCLIEHEDLLTLLAIKSTNPSIDLNGVIRFELNPSVLRYLRENPSTVESAGSKNILISADRVKKRVDLSYDPRSGLMIRAGYQISGRDGIVSKKQLRNTSDPEYIRIDEVFYPAPEEHNKRLNDYLVSEEIRIDSDRINDFFERDLEFLNTNFDLVNNTAQSQIENVRKLKSILRGML